MSNDKKNKNTVHDEEYNPALISDSDENASIRNKLKGEEILSTESSSQTHEETPIGWTIDSDVTFFINDRHAGTTLKNNNTNLTTQSDIVQEQVDTKARLSSLASEPGSTNNDDLSLNITSSENEPSQSELPASFTFENSSGKTGLDTESTSHDQKLPEVNADQSPTLSVTSQKDISQSKVADGQSGPIDFSINPPSTETVIEDNILQINGEFKVNTHLPVPGLSWHTSSPLGAYGHLELTADGHWSYILDNSSANVQSLFEGQQVSETFLITATDGFGTSRSAIITVQIVGSNDVPTLQIPPLTVIEDTPVTSGKLVGHDVDTDAILSYHCDTPPPGFTLQPDGSYTFDPADNAYQSLPAGQKVDLDIPVVVTDQHGASSQQLFKVTVVGTNDAPVLSVSPLQRVNEDSTTLQGQLKSSDVDAGDIAIFSTPAPVPGFILHADGSYTFDPSNPAYQHLADGEVQDIKVPVSVMDSKGGLDTGEILIKVVGTNDLPKLMAQPGLSLHEDDAVVKGQFTALDIDTTDRLTFSTPIPVHGFTLNPDGSYTFDPSDPAYQHLAPGDHADLQIPVIVSDGHGGTATRILQITINGTDDLPVIAATPKQTVDEDQTISGHMLATDVDDGDKLTFSLLAPVEGLTMNPDGTYTFDASHSAYQHLQATQKLDLSIPVSVADSHGQASLAVLHIAIIGSNDRAMVVGVDHAMGSVRDAQGGTLHVDGQLAVLDVDSGESLFQPQLLQGTFGILAIEPSGKWSYTADAHQPALSRLQGSQSLPEHFQVRTADGTVHDIDIAIKGQNTPAAFGGVSTGMTKEDVVGTASGKMSVSDPNAGESAFTPVDEDRPHGHFTLKADGSWTFTLNNQNSEVQQLAENGMIAERITVGSVDGTPHVVQVNIIGTNDAPMIGGVATGSVNEDATAGTIKGTLIDSDVDTGATQTWSVVGNAQGTYGSLSIDPHTGEWSYTIDNSLAATQQLAEGQPQPDSFTVRVTDEHGASAMKTVVVTVNGSNDAPVVSSAVSLPAGTEDTAVTLSSTQLLAHATDVDSGDTAQLSVHNLYVDHGSVVDNGDGTFTFHPDANYNGQVNFTYEVQDPSGERASTSASMTLVAVNDAATISGDLSKSTPDDDTAVSGHLSVTDVDTGEDHFKPLSGVNGQYGTFSLATDGSWTYTPDARADALALGQTGHESFTVESADGTTQTVVVSVKGSSDFALGGDTSGAAKEDVSTTISGDLTLTNEAGAATTPHFGDHVFQGTYGTLDLRDQGHWIYNLNNQATNIQGLKSTDVVQEQFHITMPDGTTQDVVIRITGTHDQPQIQAVDTKPPADLAAAVQITDFTGATDLDMFNTVAQGVPVGHKLVALYMPGDDHNKLDGIASSSLPTIHTAYKQAAGSGYVYLDTNGYFGQHVPDVDSGAVAPSVRNNWDGGLAVFDDGTVVRVVKVCDGQNASEHDYIYFEKIEGVNAHTGVTLISGSAAAGETVEVFEGSNLLGTATADANGYWQIGVPKLADGDHNIHTVVNGVATDPKTVAVAGDQTILHEATPLIGTTVEDGTLTASGQMHVIDADLNDHPVFTAQQDTAGTYGTFSIDANGNWHYTLDNSRAATNVLIAGQVVHEVFAVEVTTDSGERATQLVQVDVEGTNDAPIVSTGVVLSAGSEDVDVKLTAAQLLANASDVDIGDLAQLSIHNLQADHGTVTDNGDGTFTFHPDANYNGEVHFTYDVQDPQGGSVSTSATMDLAAVNDSALISGALTGGVKEDQNLNHHAGDPLDGFMNTSGKLTVSDVDSGEDHFQLQLGAAGDNGYGVFTIAPSGAWIYYADPKQSAIQELGEGRTLTDTITVTSADGTPQQITVTITGTNDAPTVLADVMAHAVDLGTSDLGQPVHFSESDLLSLIGAADVDTSDTLSVSAIAIDASVGAFAKDAASGDWVFTPVGGASATDAQVQITVTDGTTSTTAQAKLDVVPPPPLAISTITSDTGSSSTDFITSDNSLVISGTGTPGDTVRVMDGPFTSLGTAVVDATGQWSIDHTGSTLRDGTHHIMVLGKNPDGSAGTIQQPLVIDTGTPTITIEPVGQDDVLDSSDQGKPLTITGSVTHIDDGNTVTIDIAGKTYTGIVQAGTWSVTVPTADADALQDQNLLIHAHVETTAGMPAEADHHLIVSASPDTLRASGQLQEDVTVTDGGQVFRLNGDGTVDTPTSMDGNFGTLIVDASGQYHYQLNNNAAEIQALGQGESVSDHFLIPITLADGSHRMAQVDFNIAGTNDAPTITGGLSAERSVQTTATTHMSTTGQVVINDVDTHDTLSLTINGQQVDLSAGSATIDTAVGQLAIRPDGNWEYVLDKGGPERDQLNSLLNTGGSQQERFHIVVTDSHGESRVADIVVTITGDAGNPTLRGTLRAAVVEDATLEADGVLNVVDANGVKQTGVTGWTVDASHSGTYGAFSIDAQGHWHYTLNNANPAVQALAGGEQLTDHATITATDANGQPISRVVDVDITGTNDAPVISGDHIGNTAEDATASISGKLLASDIDSTDSVAFTAETLAGGFGSLTIDANGHWTYQVDNTLLATQSLNAGQTEPDTFEVTATSTDGTSIKRIITINITGREDAPVIAGSHTGTVTEDATTMTVSGDLTATDADLGDTAVLQASTQQGTYGTFSMDASGHWTYTLDSSLPATQALAGGESQPDTFTVTARTTDGETVTQDITVTVTGTNDAPTVAATDTAHAADLGTTSEDTSKTFTEAELLQLVGASDADASDTLHVTAVTSPHGTFTHDATAGHWTFTPSANYHGNDVAVTVQVSDGHATTDAHGTIDVTPVTDAAKLDLVINAEQAVIDLAGGGSDSCVEVNGIANNKPLDALAVEFTVIGGDQLPKDGVLASFSTTNLQAVMAGGGFVVRSPQDLTIIFGGLDTQEYHTGIDMTADQGSHRWSILWNGDTGTLDVLKDGHLEYHQDNVQKGYALEGYDIDGYVGNLMSAAGGAMDGSLDAWQGQLFDLSLAITPVSPSQLANGPLRDISSPTGVVFNLKAEGGQIVDTASHSPLHIYGQTSITQAMVDTKVIPPNPGALLHLNPTFTTPDPDDQVSNIRIGGFVAGTILDDGNGHSHTITSSSDSVDISRWSLTGLTAQLPQGDNTNMRISLNVETTGPDGTHAQSSTSSPVVLDTASPIPDAIIGGDSTLITEQGIVVHGVLTVQDTDSTQEHFIAQTDVDGQYGKFSIDAHGHWTYMPDVRANALAEGEPSKENFLITSADGTSQLVTVNLTGTNDAPTVTAIDVTHAADLGETEQDTAKTFTESELLQLIGASDADASDTVHVIAVTSPHGSFTQDATSGDWTFTPAADYHGDDVSVTLTVNDGHTDVTAHGTIDVSPEPSISIDSVDNSLEVQTTTTGGHQIHGANHPGNSDKFTPTAFETTSGDVTIHGSATGLKDGTQVTVHLQDTINPTNSFDLVGTVSSGQWRVTIDHTRVDNVGDHDWQVEATATNAAGTVVHTTTDIIDQGALTQHLTEGDATTSLDLLEGVDGMAVSNLLYSLDGQNYSSTIPAGFRLDVDGHSLEVDPDNAAFNSLAEGAQQTVYVKYQLSETVNGTQETINQNAVITVTGTNDAPTVSGSVHLPNLGDESPVTITEAQLLSHASDIDLAAGESLSVSGVTVDHGSITHHNDGTWTFTPEQGYTGSVQFSYQVADEHHGITHASAELTIVDNDLVPTVTATDSTHAVDLGNTAEDTSKTFTEADLLSKVGAHDSDATDTLSISGITSPHGTFTKLASGEWEFTPEANYHGDDVAVSIQVSDGKLATTAYAVIDVASVTDAATVTATGEGLHTLTTSVEVEVTQLADTIDVKIDPATMVPTKIDGADGRQFAFFPQGGVDPHLITGLVIDGHSVTGSPELITSTYSTTPDAVVFPGLDPDALVNAHTLTFTFAAGAPPTLDIQIQVDILASGSAAWDAFALNTPAYEDIHVDRSVVGHEMHDVQVQGSAEGQDIHLAITATPTDSDDHITAIKITGLPPGATLSAGTAHADGSYTLTPADLTGLKLTPDQDWKGNLELHVQVTTSDGSHDATSESMLRLNIAPQADVLTPVVTPATAEEDTSIALHISLTGHEDTSETHTVRIEGVPSGGTLSAGTKEPDGSWTLTPAQLTGLSLTPPADHDQSFTLTVSSVSTEHSGAAGQASASLSVTIHPHEDAPTIAITADPVFNEDTSYTFRAADFGFRDIDHGDTLHHVTITGLPAADTGSLLLNGHAVVAGQAIVAADIEHLVFQPAANYHGAPEVGFTVSDGQQDSAEARLMLHIQNVNDAAVITGDTTSHIDESGHMTAQGQLHAVDIDSPSSFRPERLAPADKYGIFTIEDDGRWSYRVTDDRIHSLPAGQVVTDSHTFYSYDGTPQTVTVTITTTNDAPYVTSAVTLPEETSGTPIVLTAASLLANVRDDDLQAGEHLTVHNVHSNVGTVTDNGDGTFTLVPRPGYVGPINLNYDINDGQGGTGHGRAELNIHSPVAHSDTVASGSVMEDQGIIDEHGGHFLGAAGVVSTDADGQAISFAGQTVTGDHGGSLLMTQLGGVWQARIDNDSPEVQALNTGESFVETFTVTDTDGNTHDIKITVEGTDEGAQVNPAPPASDESTGTLVEEAAPMSSDEPESAISDYMQFAVTIDSAELTGVEDSLSGSSDADSGALSGYLDVVGASPADLIEPVVMDPAQEAFADDLLASHPDSVNPDDGITQNDADSLPVDMVVTTPEHQDVQVDV